jgi:prepilin-type N-terminal cleavage/methylation domain-containing protein
VTGIYRGNYVFPESGSTALTGSICLKWSPSLSAKSVQRDYNQRRRYLPFLPKERLLAQMCEYVLSSRSTHLPQLGGDGRIFAFVGSCEGRVTRRNCGFTLIELLVVISIIALLMADLVRAPERNNA